MMIDKKTLLENGLLEQYLLGELNAKECAQIEQLLASNTDLKSHFNTLEADFERIGLDHAITPPSHIKTQLINGIKKSVSVNTLNQPIDRNLKNTNYKFGIAASIAVLLTIGSFWMYMQLNTIQQQLQTAETNNSQLNTTIKTLNLELERNNKFYNTVAHADTEQYILKGNNLMPDAKVVSYVNHNLKSVIINTERLPQLDEDHDYQMWADVKGEMINMGVIAKNKQLMSMAYINNAESLNITIEPRGGNDHPTVSQLITNIYL